MQRCYARYSACADALSCWVGEYCTVYWPVAALNLTISSAGTRPRSLTSMPWALAQSRTSVAFSSPTGVWGAAWRDLPLTRRPGPYVGSQGLPKALGVSRAEVDLVIGAVKPEADTGLRSAAV